MPDEPQTGRSPSPAKVRHIALSFPRIRVSDRATAARSNPPPACPRRLHRSDAPPPRVMQRAGAASHQGWVRRTGIPTDVIARSFPALQPRVSSLPWGFGFQQPAQPALSPRLVQHRRETLEVLGGQRKVTLVQQYGFASRHAVSA